MVIYVLLKRVSGELGESHTFYLATALAHEVAADLFFSKLEAWSLTRFSVVKN